MNENKDASEIYPSIICTKCQYLECDYDEYLEQYIYYCRLNLIFPKKMSCKRQKPFSLTTKIIL